MRTFAILLIVLLISLSVRVYLLFNIEKSPDEISLFFAISDWIEQKTTPFFTVVSYQGPSLVYLTAPFAYLFELDFLLLRLPVMIFSILTILLVFILTKRYIGEKFAILSAALMAFSSTDVLFGVRAFEFSLQYFFAIVSFYSFLKFEEEKQYKYLYLFSLMLGFGLMSRFSFLFYITALAISLLFLRKKIPKLKIKYFFICSVLFLIPILPFLIFNILKNFPSFLDIKSLAIDPFPNTLYGENLLDIQNNLYNNFISISVQLARDSYIYLLALIVSLFSFPLTYFLLRKKIDQRVKQIFARLFVINILLILFISTLTITRFKVVDFTLVFPFMVILFSFSVFSLKTIYRRFSDWFLEFIIIFILLILFSKTVSFFLSNLLPSDFTICERTLPLLLKEIDQNNASHIITDIVGTKEMIRYYARDRTDLKFDRLWITLSNMINNRLIQESDEKTVFVFMSDMCQPPLFKNLNLHPKFLEIAHSFNKTTQQELVFPSPPFLEYDEPAFIVERILK